MSTIRAYLGTAGLVDVGYRFYTQNTAEAARVTSGIVDEGEGWYSAAGVTLLGDNVRWDSTGTPGAKAREDITLRTIIEGLSLSAPQIAAAVLDAVAVDHNDAGSIGEKINNAGEAADPLATLLPGDYAEGTAGAILYKLNIGAPDAPVVVVPGAPVDAALCRVFGYFETLDNKPLAGVDIKFELVEEDDGPVKSERIIIGRTLTVKTDNLGQLSDKDGNPYVDLQRNDEMTPATTKYRVTSDRVKFKNHEITLAAETFDLATLVT